MGNERLFRKSAESALSKLGCRQTGFPELDMAIGGLWSRDLVLIAACDDGGKTALALNIAEHITLKNGLPVAYFSTHMGADQISTRMVASIGRISLDNLRTGELSEHEAPRLLSAEREMSQSSLHIEADLEWDLQEIRNRALAVANRCGQLGLIVIDSLEHLSESKASSEMPNSQGSNTLKRCATIANELDCPVIVLMRIPGEVEVRGDARPTLSDLALLTRELKHAQSILAIYRDDQYAGGKSIEPGIAQIRVLQNRFGQTTSLKLVFLRLIAKFESLASTHYRPNR